MKATIDPNGPWCYGPGRFESLFVTPLWPIVHPLDSLDVPGTQENLLAGAQSGVVDG